MAKTDNPSTRAVSGLRVAKGTMVGARECLKDALVFVNRGIRKLDQARVELSEALTEAGAPPKVERSQAGRTRRRAPTIKRPACRD